MTAFHACLAFIMHLDQHIAHFVALYGSLTYLLLFLIIFCETGLVVTAFLPGDSLLFATGTLAANPASALNIHLLFVLLVLASCLGNRLNYQIGKWLGPRLFYSNHSLLLNKKHLEKANRFYATYGSKAIVIARFMPIIRTFVPFVAGMGCMNPRQFSIYNIAGALLWIGSLLYVSYLFGNLLFIKQHFSTVILVIIGASLLPPLVEFAKQFKLKKPTLPSESAG